MRVRRRSTRAGRLLGAAVALAVLTVGAQHALYLCHASAAAEGASRQAKASDHRGGCHDGTTSGESRGHEGSPPLCCGAGVLLAPLPAGKGLAPAGEAPLLRLASVSGPSGVALRLDSPPAPSRRAPGNRPGEGPFPGLRPHLALATLLL